VDSCSTKQRISRDHLVAELTFPEIRPTPAGKPRIRAAEGKHDDHPMALATVVPALAAGGKNDKFYGSIGATADDWVTMLADEAKKAEGERPQITTAVLHHVR
jgi:hypothetical protein